MANSIVKIGPPGGPFVEIDEVDGNTVFRVPNDEIDFENVDFTNVANALLSGGNFDGQGTSSLTNLAAVETEEQFIDGYRFAKIDEYVQNGDDSNSVTIDFSGLSIDKRYIIRVGPPGAVLLSPPNSGRLLLHFNGDDAASNDNYAYFDETGTKNENQDEIEVVDYATSARICGDIVVDPGGTGMVGVDNRLAASRPERWAGYADKGGWNNNNADITTINLTSTGGIRDGQTVELWEALA